MSPPNPEFDAAPARSASQPTAGKMRSFPLLALVQLATYLAALTACIDGRAFYTRLGQTASDPIIAVSLLLAAACLVGLVGVIIGASQLQLNRSALAGGAVGALYGIIILAIYAAPAPLERAAAAAALTVLTTIAFRIRAA